MRQLTLPAVISVATLCAAPVVADCGTVAGRPDLCVLAVEAAVEINRAMPVELFQMRLTAAVSGGEEVVVLAEPAIGGPYPEQETAVSHLCADAATASFVAAGGRVKVLLADWPFVTITSCEDP